MPLNASTPPVATILITTRNRKDDLRLALRSAVAQDAAVEVIVIDDGSTDGTPELVRAEFPDVRLVAHPAPAGYIVRRVEGVRLAKAPIIVSVDDDAVFTTPQVVSQVLREFDHPRVGACTIPLMNVRVNPGHVYYPAEPGRERHCAPAFVGTAHALRRDVFLALGGYRTVLFHMAEEEDYGLRLLDAGYVVSVGNADRIDHFTSPKRVASRALSYATRNRVLRSWHNTPFPDVLLDLPKGVVSSLVAGVRARHPAWSLWGVSRGLALAATREWRNRRPASRAVFRMWLRMRRFGTLPLAEVEPVLSRPVSVVTSGAGPHRPEVAAATEGDGRE